MLPLDLVSEPPPQMELALVPAFTVSTEDEPRFTVPPLNVVIALVAPFRLAVPPDIVPMVATPLTVVLPLLTELALSLKRKMGVIAERR